MKKLILLVLISALPAFYFNAAGQAVSLKCLEVMPDGNVLVYWNPLIVGTGFYNYTIYWSSVRSGPYIDSTIIVDLTQDTYLHTGAGANMAPVYYYLVTNKDSGPSPPSDTLGTMLLTASTPDFEIVDLSWTPLHTPFLPDVHPWYLLYREYPQGTWNTIDSTQVPGLTHHFWECNGNSDTVRFRIGVRNTSYDCISFSNQRSAVLKNLSNRFPPVIDSVSIDVNGHAVIGWQPGSEPDIQGYKIFSVTSANDSIDYADGRYNNAYTHQLSDPCSGPMRYIILSVDSCGNESPFPFDPGTLLDKPHSTIYLADIQYDPCLVTNTLAWNEYENFDPPLDFTRIYVSENGGSFGLLASIPPGQVTYTHSDLQPNTHYTYFVRAYSQDQSKSSTSCRKEITTYNSPRPLFMYTRYVTVENNDRANLLFYTDTNAHVQMYRILRSTSPGGPFTEVGSVLEEGEEYITFTDMGAEVSKESYYYQVEVIDSCGIPSIIANTARTIFLQAEALPDFSNRLTWNAYESWSGSIQGYKIYRRLDDSSPELLADVDPLTLTYTDNVSGLSGSISRMTYLVEAYEGISNAFGFREQSYSNEVLSEQEPEVYLPNAFAPKGTNNLFKPVIVFVGIEGYELNVYNRWGQKVFETNDPGEGWDGRYNGDYVPGGVYVYLVRFRNALDQGRQVKGNVAVIY